jgi:cell division septation protein DedD
MKPAMAGAALLPQAAVRSVGAVRDFSDSGLIVRLTRGRGWIAVLCALLGGIVALNVLSLSLTAGSGRLSLQIDDLKGDVSALRAEIDERLSAARVEAEAQRLGLAVPDPKAITYLSAKDGDAERLAHLLATDGFLMAPSQPSSYPTNGETYAPVPVTSEPPTTTVAPTSTPTTPTTTPSAGGGSAGTAPSSGSPSSSSGSTAGSTASTGGVGL